MFAFLKPKNPYSAAARSIYAQMLTHVRQQDFYTQCGVPDSFDGRFDLLLLHAYLVQERMMADEAGESCDLVARDFNQALFDVTFFDMDQTLREMGIGDMGIPKHQKRMMKAFNGRMHIYAEVLDAEDFKSALRKNLYGTVEVDNDVLSKMMDKIDGMRQVLKSQSVADILSGHVSFE